MFHSLHEILLKSVDFVPDKIAVRHKDREIRYNDLHFLSDKVASCLISNGLVSGDRVCIYIDKSIEALIAIWGILKAGGCYVPLDPMGPPLRQAKIISDCKARYLIVSADKLQKLQGQLNPIDALQFIFVLSGFPPGDKICDRIQIISYNKIMAAKKIVSYPTIRASDLAYILYTSGSTGNPKGVMISHRAALSFIKWAYKYFEVTSEDILSSHAPFHFDLSIFDIYVSAMAAATLCLLPSGISSFPVSLARFIHEQKISIWYSVPYPLIQLALYGELKKINFPFLRSILFAGEVFPIRYLRQLMELIPEASYYNLYGPTETNVVTCYHLKALPELEGPVPIGRPCEGVEVFVVDESLNLVKGTDIGELYVKTPTLMDGYWNDRERTDSVILQNSRLCPEGKVYKTGDMVRYDKGELIYIGRYDNMIKLRGYRIEPEEIESVLLSHPAVKEACVFCLGDNSIKKNLKAAVVLFDGAVINEQDLRSFCAHRLPLYMVPEEIIFKDSLLRLPTGKIDREALVNIS